ncbi:MAG: aldehyde ferredoxin oxidoreductase family protein [Desulfobacterales bacterium]|nr:aldehyde ferredoxin oxidoreductase family protein [Desulfobacterales bacterium]
MFGWAGTIIRIDLTNHRIAKQPLDGSIAEKFLGGRGLNSKTLFDEIKSQIDPLSPENIICIAPGLLSATGLGLSSRVHVSTLSAYSGILGDGNAGGSFAYYLKRAGYDQIVISGRANKPSYLLIQDEKITIEDASDLWGKTTWEATDILIKRHGKDISVACIGQAGENLVRLASTIVDKYSSAARGSGAVWGSKNLKAIVVKGTGNIKLAHIKEFLTLTKKDIKFLHKDKVQQEVAAQFGSHFGMKHWFPGHRNSEKRLSADEIPDTLRHEAWKQYEVGRTGCQSCHIRCKNVFEIPSGNRKGEIGEALEYECIYCLGTNCGIYDPVAIMEMENLADAYGIDIIALGNTIGFAKDLYNRGIINQEDTGGLKLDWEDAGSQIELIHKTALREGFGNLIAEGMYSMAKIIDKGAMNYCYHVKGLSRGVYPAGLFALSHAVSSRGADHLRGRSWAAGDNSDEKILQKLKAEKILTKDPVQALGLGERVTAIADSIGRCKGAVNTWTCTVPLVWMSPIWKGLAKLLTAATGIEFDTEMIEKAADRIHAVERAFNIVQGITIIHDRIPQKPEMKDTPAGKKEREKHFEMVKQYYKKHGYDPVTGIPKRNTLKSLDLEYVADTLDLGGPYKTWDGPLLWPVDKYPHGGKRA